MLDSADKNRFEATLLSLKHKIICFLEVVQDFIILLLCFGLFGVMFVKLTELFTSLLPPIHFKIVTPDILFILILVEIFRLLILYLEEKEISVSVAVKITIVSILRELILRGVMEIPNSQVWSISGILLVLSIMLVIPEIKILFDKVMSSSLRKVFNNFRSTTSFKSSNYSSPHPGGRGNGA